MPPADVGRIRAILPPDFAWLFPALLAGCGLALLALGIVGSRSPDWLLADVPLVDAADPTYRFDTVADRDLVYEMELAFPEPPDRAERKSFVDEQRNRAPSGLEWFVHNPRGRVAAGNDGEVLYVVRDMTDVGVRLKHLLLGSPFIPPEGDLIPWLVSGPPKILVGIGQWRARKGQRYMVQVDWSELSAPVSKARFRVRARRLTWDEHARTAIPRAYAGLLLVLLACLLALKDVVGNLRRRA